VAGIFGAQVDRALDVLVAGGALEGASLEDLGALLTDRFGAGTIGLRWDRITLERGEAHLDPTEALHQPSGIVHGGVWCSIIESMASVCAALTVLPAGLVCVGAHNATDFLRPHRAGRVGASRHRSTSAARSSCGRWSSPGSPTGRTLARGQVRLANVDPEQLRG
jgi:1,4-dihydroxy-2-naphthoyl-CoA hydrolase